MIPKIKINDVFNVDEILTTDNNYLFTFLRDFVDEELTRNNIVFDDTPFDKFLSENIQTLNVGYFIEHSNQKYISPLFDRLLKIKEENDYSLDWVFERLCEMISKRYAVKWFKIYDALITTYKPLENYSMTEHREHDTTVKNNTDITTNVSNDNGLHGFNSGDTSNPTTDSNGENHVTGDANDNYQNDNGSEDVTRTGNIGVTTSQQMLESEIKLRQYDIEQQIFNDIDKILCLSIY